MATPADTSPFPLRAMDIHEAPERFHHHEGTALMTLKLHGRSIIWNALQHRLFVILEASCAKMMSGTLLVVVTLSTVRDATCGGYVFLITSLVFMPLLKALDLIAQLYLRILKLESAGTRFFYDELELMNVSLKLIRQKLALLAGKSRIEILKLLRNPKHLRNTPTYFQKHVIDVHRDYTPYGEGQIKAITHFMGGLQEHRAAPRPR
ncbi:hypothetical protein [Vreelandella titanicae]|uniref:hypothetical protein n=1 Tax=Vreelandella titanicae TaxID=664683 RepID=UPI0037F39F43